MRPPLRAMLRELDSVDPELSTRLQLALDRELHASGARVAALLADARVAVGPCPVGDYPAVHRMRRAALLSALDSMGAAEQGAALALTARWASEGPDDG